MEILIILFVYFRVLERRVNCEHAIVKYTFAASTTAFSLMNGSWIVKNMLIAALSGSNSQ